MRFLCCISVLCLLAACSSAPSADPRHACTYRQRDLTVSWYERSYWCTPDAAPLPAVAGGKHGH